MVVAVGRRAGGRRGAVVGFRGKGEGGAEGSRPGAAPGSAPSGLHSHKGVQPASPDYAPLSSGAARGDQDGNLGSDVVRCQGGRYYDIINAEGS